jgi:hypothetical protein
LSHDLPNLGLPSRQDYRHWPTSAQLQCLLCKLKALSSNPSPTPPTTHTKSKFFQQVFIWMKALVRHTSVQCTWRLLTHTCSLFSTSLASDFLIVIICHPHRWESNSSF